MNFPEIAEPDRLHRLEPVAGKIDMVLDTDTFNEIDDQFALTYALKSLEKLNIKAVYAAPFHNARSADPADGMQKSYQEILKILSLVDINADDFVFRGSTRYLSEWQNSESSEAVEDLIQRAQFAAKKPLYVVCIGALTNLANAIIAEPDIITNIAVVWLGGHAHHWQHTKEFNMKQDLLASRLIFDSGVPLLQIPCQGVASHLAVSGPEIEKYVAGKGQIGDYLAQIYRDFEAEHQSMSKVIWDIAPVAYLINSDWVLTNLTNSPIITDQITYSFNPKRHLMRIAYAVKRDSIFQDFFSKLSL
ncbi:MAG TPA: nucleoside hydrolase [bacterium]|nr:nucleoside hydrolase [bacterium]